MAVGVYGIPLWRFPGNSGSGFQSLFVCKKASFSVSGAWQGSDIPFEMSRTHYFTLQNYHKTTDGQSKIRVFCFAHPPSNTNFAETFRDRAVVCPDFGCPGNSVIVSCGIKLSPSSIRLPTQTAPVCKQYMRVLLVNTSETVGGAAVAANRLLRALNRNGVEAELLVRDKQTKIRASLRSNTSGL